MYEVTSTEILIGVRGESFIILFVFSKSDHLDQWAYVDDDSNLLTVTCGRNHDEVIICLHFAIQYKFSLMQGKQQPG